MSGQIVLELRNSRKEAVMINIVDAAKYLISLDKDQTVFNKNLEDRETVARYGVLCI